MHLKLFSEDEMMRLDPLLSHDASIMDQYGRIFVCGTDEVGRGALAGSIVAASCILRSSASFIDIKDSKKFSSRNRRGEVAEQIMEHVVSHSISWVDAMTIDEVGIQEANRRVMIEAISGLEVKPDDLVAILDGNPLWNGSLNGVECVWMHGADSSSQAVAAASIIAKVARDDVMVKLGESYPEYGFERHVGYGAKEHIEAIKKYGKIPGIHRNSFIHFTGES